MLLDRKISISVLCLGVALLISALLADWSEHARDAVIFLAIDCIFFTLISFGHPRTDAELKSQAVEGLKFTLLSVAVLGFVAGVIYLVAGAPRSVSDQTLLTIIVFGLPAALVLPPVLRRLVAKGRT